MKKEKLPLDMIHGLFEPEMDLCIEKAKQQVADMEEKHILAMLIYFATMESTAIVCGDGRISHIKGLALATVLPILRERFKDHLPNYQPSEIPFEGTDTPTIKSQWIAYETETMLSKEPVVLKRYSKAAFYAGAVSALNFMLKLMDEGTKEKHKVRLHQLRTEMDQTCRTMMEEEGT